MKERKKAAQIAGTVAQMLSGLLVGGLCGLLLVTQLGPVLFAEGMTGITFFLILGCLLVSIYLFAFIHIVAHEAGHLIGGLLTGYCFSSFRVGSLMILRSHGKLICKRLHIAGTGGQCLMEPPALVNGLCPVFLYNLGGPLMNLLLAAIAGILSLPLHTPTAALALQLFALIGLFIALTNGIPMRMGGVDNDGYNARSLKRDKAALRAFWIQMQIAAQSVQGVRLKNMPEAWFDLPTQEQMGNNLIASLAVFRCNRLMDELRVSEAAAAIDSLLAQKSGILGLHRNLLQCEQLFLELVGENRPEVTARLHTKDLAKFIKSMRNYPSVLRLQYAWAKLALRDEAAAAQLLQQFEKIANQYPYTSEIAGERELLSLVEVAAK